MNFMLTRLRDYRLTDFVNTGYEKCKLKLSDSDIKEHKKEIISKVRRLCDKLGELYPVFEVGDILPNGSYFKGSKIIHPDECDLLLLFKQLSVPNVRISEKSIVLSIVFRNNRVQVKIRTENLKTQINDIKQALGVHMEVIDDEDNLTPYITHLLHSAIHTCLSELEGIHYKGKRRLGPTSSEWDCLNRLRQLHQEGSTSLYEYIIEEGYRYNDELNDSCRNGTYDPYLSPNTIELDARLHGPCVRIRIGGGKYTTDIDLGFCIEQQQTEDGRYIVLPYKNEVYDNALLTKSLYNSKHKLDKHHNKLLMLLKLLIMECHLIPDSFTYNSHALKTLVLHHQATCRSSEISLGGCLCDVAHHVFELYEMKEEDGHVWIYDSRKKLEDVDFRGVDVQPRIIPRGYRQENYWMMPVVLYITIRALRSGCCTGEEALNVDRWLIISELWNNKGEGGYIQINEWLPEECKIPIGKIDELITRLYSK
ncbi:unnamed protein product [Owenia fusiformis]|uniref:Uncharacterized protein n=1 Tax=Owenia fusiformis TaxID=6347 RepID=A0A8J1V0B6_OWEFU|nr:unnamed protein product [Owenia fusiformis]